MFENEEWRACVQAPDYMVSSMGRVRNKRGRIRKPNIREYHQYLLIVDGRPTAFEVQRLVCAAWHGPAPSPTHHARHLDDNPNHNAVANIMWGTPLENGADRRGRKNRKRPFGWHHEVRRLALLFSVPKRVLARLYETDARSIRTICKTDLYHGIGQPV